MKEQEIEIWIKKMFGYQTHNLIFDDTDTKIYKMTQKTFKGNIRKVVIWCFKTSINKDNWSIFPPSRNHRDNLKILQKEFDLIWNSNEENFGKLIT